MRSRAKNPGERGIALIVVLCMTSVMVAAAVQMISSTRREISETANLREGLQALYLARSGIAFSEAGLNLEAFPYVGLDQPWADGKAWSAQFNALFKEGQCVLDLEDETGKIPINYLINKNGSVNASIRDVLLRLFNQPDWNLAEEQGLLLVNRLQDWMIANSQPAPEPAGSNSQAKTGKKGPFKFLDDLLKSGVVTRDLLYGSAARPGLASYVTVYSGGKININTAPVPVLRALFPGINEETLAQMDSFRKSGQAKLDDPAWYREIIGTSGLNPPSDLITINSQAIRVSSTGLLGSCRRTVTGILEKDGEGKKFKLGLLLNHS